MKKFQVSDFGLKFDTLEPEQKKFMENIASTMCDVVNKALEGVMEPAEVEKSFKEINDKLASKGESYEQLIKDNEELVKQVKELGNNLEKLKQKGVTPEFINKFDENINKMFDSEKFQDFVNGNVRKSGEFEGFTLKDVSLTSNYVGDVLVSQQEKRVVSPYSNRRIHMRDIVRTLEGDPEHTTLTYTQITDFDRNARFETENGRLKESSFSAKEVTDDTKRIGTFLRISKRMLKSRVFVRSFILNMLPGAIYQNEDFGLLFGDGTGSYPRGIANHPNVKPIETLISTEVVKGEAASVKSVASYNGGKDCLVEFAKAQPAILDGMTVIFTGATQNTSLSTAHEVVKVNDRQVVVLGAAYTEEETTVSKMTFKAYEAGFKSIEDPNTEDAIRTAVAALTYAQYNPTLLVLNPMTVNAIQSEKDTTGRSLNIVTVQNGVKFIAGVPVFEFAGIAPGKYLLGDFDNGANIVDYTKLKLEWAEDVECKLANQVVLIASEEFIFPIYMPWAFSYGSIAALKTAITKG